jgi:hypothetical protein
MERPRKKLTDLIMKTVRSSSAEAVERYRYLQLERRPKQYCRTRQNEKCRMWTDRTGACESRWCRWESLGARGNGQTDIIPCGLVIKCIGYRGIHVSETKRAIRINGIGRISKSIRNECSMVNIVSFAISKAERSIDLVSTVPVGLFVERVVSWSTRLLNVRSSVDRPPLYSWRTVFAFLLFIVARRIVDDIEQGQLTTHLDEKKSSEDGLMVLAQARDICSVSFEDWQTFDAYETNLGSTREKPQEKMSDLHQKVTDHFVGTEGFIAFSVLLDRDQDRHGNAPSAVSPHSMDDCQMITNDHTSLCQPIVVIVFNVAFFFSHRIDDGDVFLAVNPVYSIWKNCWAFCVMNACELFVSLKFHRNSRVYSISHLSASIHCATSEE